MPQRPVHIPQVPSPSSHPGGDHDDDLSPAVRSGWTDQEARRAHGLLNVSWVQNGEWGEKPELKLEWKRQHLRSAGSMGRGEGLSALLGRGPTGAGAGALTFLLTAIPAGPPGSGGCRPSPTSQEGPLTREMRLERVRAREISTLSSLCAAGRSSLL